MLRYELLGRFGEIADPQHALTVLRKIKQSRNENIQIFSERVLGLAEEAFAVQTSDLNQQVQVTRTDLAENEERLKQLTRDNPLFPAIEHLVGTLRQQISQLQSAKSTIDVQLIGFFTDGLLDQNIKYKVMRQNPPTMAQAVEIALFEQNFKTRFALRTGQEYSYSSTVRHETPMEIDHSKSRKCYGCGKYGHISKDCRSKHKHPQVNAINQTPTSTNEPQPTNPDNARFFPDVQCYYCKDMGHYKSDCPKLKRKLEREKHSEN